MNTSICRLQNDQMTHLITSAVWCFSNAFHTVVYSFNFLWIHVATICCSHKKYLLLSHLLFVGKAKFRPSIYHVYVLWGSKLFIFKLGAHLQVESTWKSTREFQSFWKCIGNNQKCIWYLCEKYVDMKSLHCISLKAFWYSIDIYNNLCIFINNHTAV